MFRVNYLYVGPDEFDREENIAPGADVENVIEELLRVLILREEDDADNQVTGVLVAISEAEASRRREPVTVREEGGALFVLEGRRGWGFPGFRWENSSFGDNPLRSTMALELLLAAQPKKTAPLMSMA